ncbi:hypothetical protein [Ilyobacter polytropus]|uniref:Uncharacterized protein n=1 Tax=Ilyobacter polytropus (strain ATCC 51220 / DSM 2926 / LMG 16218 / CuHBu1) TaxID=572544 RepID=E3H6B4_ILYPC|nr:hypothetical protein [Ilyobacter polytropus]ADO82327.1 hypothetical protein Ilyop_0539 [Ilyobacter polytropus DSM 2926]
MFRFVMGIVLAAFITENVFFSRYDSVEHFSEDKNDERTLGIMALTIIGLIWIGYSFSYLLSGGKLFTIMVIIFFLGEMIKNIFRKYCKRRDIDDLIKITIILSAFNINFEKGYIENLILVFISGFTYFIFCLIFANINERLEYLEIPKFMEGGPIKVVTFALIAMVFYAFTGIKI